MQTIIYAGQTPANSESTSVREIKKLHGSILHAAKTSLNSAIRIGELLIGIRTKIPYGIWESWSKKHLPFDVRTARNYCRCFEQRDRLTSETVSDLTDAYKFLAEPKERLSSDSDREISEADFLALPEDDSLPHDDFGIIESIVLQRAFAAGQTVTRGKILEFRSWANSRRAQEEAAV